MGADRVYWASVVEQQEEDMSSFLEMEDILEFSNEDIAGPIEHHNSGGSCTSASAMETQSSSSSISCNNNFSVFSIPATAEPGHEAHLCIPDDDLGELEWLTKLVEGGTSDHETKSVATPAYHEFSDEAFNSSQQQQTYNYSTETASTSLQKRTPAFDPEISVPAKARSKRSRAPAGNLSSRIVVSSCTSSHSSSVSSESSVADSSSMKRSRDDANYSYNREEAQQRKCSHCETNKTPQWRTGPLGPKTLCNACGVRYKSGRLVPEYRPAASPTFVPSKHSNSHRKVMEMRRQKDRRLSLFHGSANTSSSSSSSNSNTINNNNKNTNNPRICNSGNKNIEDDENSQNRHCSWFDFSSSSTSSSDYDYDYDGCLLTTTRHDYRQLIL